METKVDQEIKELEARLSSLKAEQQLLRAQESLNKEKAASLLEDESLTEFIQQLKEKLVEHKLGLALSLNYKQNWAFLVKEDISKDGLSDIKVLDPKDKCIFYGSIDSYSQEVTPEGIRTWFTGTLKLVESLKKIKLMLEQDGLYGVTFMSYDSAFSKIYFTLSHFILDSYDCVLTVKRPYTLNMSQQLNYDAEFSEIYFLGGGVSLVIQANTSYIHDDDCLGDFKQKLTVKNTFTKLTELSDVSKELQDKLATFYEALEPSFK